MNLDLQTLAALSGMNLWVMVLVLIWTLSWKGVALWKSARLNQPVWFIILLLVNLFGIIEILYIFLFSKIKLEDNKTAKANTRKKRIK